MKSKNRIVVLLGAGFPLMWGAPTSQNIKDGILKILRSNKIGKEMVERINVSDSQNFEYLLSVIEAIIIYHIQLPNFQFTNKVFKIDFDYDVNDIYTLYQNCINYIIGLVHNYELKIRINDAIANSLKNLFKDLGNKYNHVCFYSLNYDEIIPNLLEFDNKNIGLNEDGRVFEYDFHNIRSLRYSFYNLHGSIYLNNEYLIDQYEIVHSPQPTKYCAPIISNYGGNPEEILLFSPIITGHNKTQRILDKHFSFPFASFMMDLSECDTILAIGYSFSDPHINSQIRQFTRDRDVNYRIITKEDGQFLGSSLEKNITNNIGISQYTPDTKKDDFFEWKNQKMIVYKRGIESFLQNSYLWQRL